MEKTIAKLNKVGKIEIGTFPTPIHRLNNLEKFCGFNPIYIKRDDLTGLGPGGNKIRSLEYILDNAIKKKYDTILVAGPLQSNLCTLCASSCMKLGLRCILIHNGDKPDVFQGNLLLNDILGVESHFLGNVSSEKRGEHEKKIFNDLKQQGAKPYIIANGASSGYGAMGYVNAVIEMVNQKSKNHFNFNEIFVPGGNGGVAAGTVFGNAVLGFPFKINVISVEHDKAKLSHEILKLISQLEAITDISFDHELENACLIKDAYRGKGWGCNTEESKQMIYDFSRSEGIFIENVYNSKVLVGMMDMVKTNQVNDGVCFLHTGGFGSLFSQF